MSEGAGRITVGLIGIGRMGSRLSRALLDAGYALAVHDGREAAMAPIVEQGARACGSAAEVADRASIVLASLPTPEALRDVVCGERGLKEGGAIEAFVDLSTCGPIAAEMARALEAEGVGYLDAPVTGGVAGAEARKLTVLASGRREVFERVRPILETFGETVLHVGAEPGQGQTAKLLNNLLSATALAITSEALVLGLRAGLRADALLAAFNAGSGRNTATAVKFPRHIVNRRFDSGFALRLMLKDLRLCLAQAQELDQPMVLGGLVEQLWALAASASDEEADHTEVVRLFERQARTVVEVSADSTPTHV